MTHCWTARHEAMGFDTATAVIVAVPSEELDRLAAENGYPEEEMCAHWFKVLEDVCLLEDGHAGPCAFTPTSGITVTFLLQPEARVVSWPTRVGLWLVT